MNDRRALGKLLDFIQDTHWETMSEEVRNQSKKCFLDLAAVLCCGAKNNSAKKAAAYVEANYPTGDVTIYSTGKKSNLIGAALANGMSANALDLDDGYSLLRGHPGSGFFGALLSAAEASDCTYGELLAAIVVAYETGIRQGYSIRDYFTWDHSSGSYSAFATAASVGKLLGLNRQELEMALSIADFIAPVNPAKRSCYVPSMNKDGIYYGQHAGTQAVMMAKAGITGRNAIILDEKYIPYIDTLGEKYYMFDLYIKFYSCCRWAHSPICAISDLMKEYGFTSDEVEKVDVYTFGNAGTLYRNAPTCEDEAQYNIIYPLAAQLIFGNCSPLESSTTKMLDPRVKPMVERIEFHQYPEYDKVFPGKRLSHVQITLNDGRVLKSVPYEPKGDHNADVTIQDMVEKAHKFNELYAPKEMVDEFVDAVLNTDPSEPFAKVLEPIKKLAATNIHPEIEFI